jgi:low temperature requirement protein LtrA
VARGPVLLAALLSVTTTICLWWLYFANAAAAGSRALAAIPRKKRGWLAGNAYTLAHIPLIAGIIYLALGLEQVLAHPANNRSGPPCPGATGLDLDRHPVRRRRVLPR